MIKRFSISIAAALVTALPASAQFYQGKTLTVVVNYGAGGNIDTEARLFVRHLPKHIPGTPTIIVRNVPGAGGVSAINQLGRGVIGAPDGLTVGFFTLNPIAPMIDDPVLKVNYNDFRLVAGLGGWIVAYGRKDIKPGMTKPADIARATDIFAAGYATSSQHDARIRLTLDIIGAKYRVVTGYQSAAIVNQSMERGEVNYTTSSAPAFYSQVVPNLIKTGIAMPFWVYGVSAPGGRNVGSPDHERQGIKTFVDVYTEAHGKPPSGPKFEAYQMITDISTKLSRVVVAPPKTAQGPVAELTKAFVSLMNDKDFQAEHLKVIGVKPELVMPEEGARLLAMLPNVSQAAKNEVKQAVSAK